MRLSTQVVAGVLVGMSLTLLAGGAHAADPWSGQPAPAPPPAGAPGAPPPGYPQGAPPAGYPQGYGPSYAPPPGFSPYPPGPYGNGAPPAMFMYEAQKKNEFLALAIEFFVPGVGSIYAEHVAGALLTWATSVAGIALIFWWFSKDLQHNQNGTFDNNGSHDTWAIYLGLGLIFGGRIYGLVDSYSSAKDYNRQLRARLGMPEWASLGVVPIRTDRAVSWGPSLSLRF